MAAAAVSSSSSSLSSSSSSSSSSSAEKTELLINLDKLKISDKQLGSGGSGDVYLGKYPEKYGEEALAIKIIKTKSSIKRQRLENEINMLKLVGGYPGITKLLAYAVNGSIHYLVFKLHQCKDLYEIVDQSKLKPDIVKQYATEILQALQYMHSKGVTYTDLKLENIMLDCDKPGINERIVLIDLGGACFSNDNNCEKTSFGTLNYMSPERVSLNLNSPAGDIWAFGIIVYELLVSPIDKDVKAIKLVTDYDNYPDTMDNDAKQFLRSIFVSYKERPTADDLLKSKWISG